MVTSVWPPIISIGIVAATLCSALASLVSAPKIFQVSAAIFVCLFQFYFEVTSVTILLEKYRLSVVGTLVLVPIDCGRRWCWRLSSQSTRTKTTVAATVDQNRYTSHEV